MDNRTSHLSQGGKINGDHLCTSLGLVNVLTTGQVFVTLTVTDALLFNIYSFS